MQSISFGNFQAGQVDDPTNELGGGFEFASGMDIFTEPGVIKASLAMQQVTFGSGATPTALPTWMIDVYDTLASTYRSYAAAGSKLLECNDGSTFNLFLTNSKGTIKGLGPWAGDIIYASDGFLGSATVGQSGTQNDSFHGYGSFTTANFYPIIQQAGTLKVGAGRYITSLDESLTVTDEAMKLAENFRINCFGDFNTNLYMGTVPLSPNITDSSAFGWGGIPLASGSALPDSSYPMTELGMNALHSDGLKLLSFAGNKGDILKFDGSTFAPYRQLMTVRSNGATLTVNPGAVAEYDNTILFSGNASAKAGVYQMADDGAICQAFVPTTVQPDAATPINIGFIKSGFGGVVYIGYNITGSNTYLIERTSATGIRQSNSVLKTVWHRIAFGRTLKQRGAGDKMKRWGGVKLNLKPMATGTSVAIAYRTDPNTAFIDSGFTVTSANQDKPVYFSASPRSRSIQFKFTFTTNGTATPELLTYDPFFDITNSTR